MLLPGELLLGLALHHLGILPLLSVFAHPLGIESDFVQLRSKLAYLDLVFVVLAAERLQLGVFHLELLRLPLVGLLHLGELSFAVCLLLSDDVEVPLALADLRLVVQLEALSLLLLLLQQFLDLLVLPGPVVLLLVVSVLLHLELPLQLRSVEAERVVFLLVREDLAAELLDLRAQLYDLLVLQEDLPLVLLDGQLSRGRVCGR